MEYNGSGIVAMVGKDCVAIASDMRFGVQQTTLAGDMHKVKRSPLFWWNLLKYFEAGTVNCRFSKSTTSATLACLG